MNKNAFTYKKSGVNISDADKFVNFISKISTKKEATKSIAILEDLDRFQISQKMLKIPKLSPVQMVLEQK